LVRCSSRRRGVPRQEVETSRRHRPWPTRPRSRPSGSVVPALSSLATTTPSPAAANGTSRVGSIRLPRLHRSRPAKRHPRSAVVDGEDRSTNNTSGRWPPQRCRFLQSRHSFQTPASSTVKLRWKADGSFRLDFSFAGTIPLLSGMLVTGCGRLPLPPGSSRWLRFGTVVPVVLAPRPAVDRARLVGADLVRRREVRGGGHLEPDTTFREPIFWFVNPVWISSGDLHRCPPSLPRRARTGLESCSVRAPSCR